jgi:hypothetical protein
MRWARTASPPIPSVRTWWNTTTSALSPSARRSEPPAVGEPGRDEPDAPRSPSRDLSKNVAGVGVSHEAVRRRQQAGAQAARSWDVGAKGEHQVGDVLNRMAALSWWDRVRGRSPRWRVLHAVQMFDAG